MLYVCTVCSNYLYLDLQLISTRSTTKLELLHKCCALGWAAVSVIA